jgi:hypothetical protein
LSAAVLRSPSRPAQAEFYRNIGDTFFTSILNAVEVDVIPDQVTEYTHMNTVIFSETRVVGIILFT